MSDRFDPDVSFDVTMFGEMPLKGKGVAEPSGVAEELVRALLEEIGDNPERPSLLDTPKRVVKSWNTIYEGYTLDPRSIFTVFDGEGYDEIIIMKDIEFFSMCEHHMLPFYGKAHVAYLPKKNGKVVGASKLARVVDLHARRLQMQERICQGVTKTLNEYLDVRGAACIIEAKHMCMNMRGVQKQCTNMITSSLTGEFKTDPSVKAELMSLLK